MLYVRWCCPVGKQQSSGNGALRKSLICAVIHFDQQGRTRELRWKSDSFSGKHVGKKQEMQQRCPNFRVSCCESLINKFLTPRNSSLSPSNWLSCYFSPNSVAGDTRPSLLNLTAGIHKLLRATSMTYNDQGFLLCWYSVILLPGTKAEEKTNVEIIK